MSVKSKVLATAASLTMLGGVATAGVLGTTAGVLGTTVAANAVTPSCGITCLDIFSREFGRHRDPLFLLDVWRGRAQIGQPMILFRESNSDVAEDFRPEFQGTVADFLAAGMVTPAFALHYGCNATFNFPDCFGLSVISNTSPFYPGLCNPATITAAGCTVSLNDPAFEIEYTPLGQFSGLCMGVASTAVQEEGVTLQPCGASSKTVWAVDLFDQPLLTFFRGYAPLINGSDTNFSQPFVLTYPASGYPTDKPRPQLQVDNLQGFSQQFPPILPFSNYPTVPDSQIWGADFGGTHFGVP
jgi:hypothetical protein